MESTQISVTNDGRLVTGEEAHHIGLADRVAPPDELMPPAAFAAQRPPVFRPEA